ncbi:protein kinase [Kitasatospora sp. NPDC006697]|uniref:protein kinase domain-containing protein n=1 Tax=Kitasatospora sp. NPDC006697 TaxID=3364020 RepID=UPI0036BBF485
MQELGAADPRRVGPFEILAVLGRGGMGTVYLGRPAPLDPVPNEDEPTPGTPDADTPATPATPATPGLVAVKVVHADLARDEEFRARFRGEVAASQAVSGPHLAAVIGSGETDERPWLATEYIPGPSLRSVLAQHGALPVNRVRALGAGLTQALAAIHQAGLVHRDVKPANVLMAETGPTLIDFGIALGAGEAGLTREGVLLGTAHYMSPEQLRDEGATVGPPADIFALACVLAYAAGGTHPFGDGKAEELLYRIAHEEPDLGALDPALAPVLRRCLAKRPEERPTAVELGEILGGDQPLPEADPNYVLTTVLPPVPRPSDLSYLDGGDPPLPPAPPSGWQRWLVPVGAAATATAIVLLVVLPGNSPGAPARAIVTPSASASPHSAAPSSDAPSPTDPPSPSDSGSPTDSPSPSASASASASPSATPSATAPASSAPPTPAAPSPTPSASAAAPTPSPSPSPDPTPSPSASTAEPSSPAPTGSSPAPTTSAPTGSAPPTSPPPGSPPRAMTPFSAVPQGKSVLVTWAPAPDATSYLIHYRESSGLHQQTSPGTSAKLDNPTGGTVCITMQAVNDFGTSPSTAQQCV